MSASESSVLSHDPAFIGRVRILGCKYCITVSSESYGGEGQPTAAQHNKRITYANKFLLDSEAQAVPLSGGVAAGANGGIITPTSTDGDIEFTIIAIFDAFAGVVPAVVE